MKLNLGSGNNRIDGFISVDLYDEEADVRADITELPYEANSVDEIVCYQVVEHVPYNKSEQMFEEMCRVLKPSGTAIIETPDVDIVCQKILEEGLQPKWIYSLVGEYYRPWDKDRYEDWEHNAASIHRNPWNFNRIKEIATRAGFSQVIQHTELKDKHPDYQYEETLSVRLVK